MKYDATLYFKNEQSALDAGYCDAVLVDDDIPELGYMAVVSFQCDGYEIEPGEEDEDMVVAV